MKELQVTLHCRLLWDNKLNRLNKYRIVVKVTYKLSHCLNRALSYKKRMSKLSDRSYSASASKPITGTLIHLTNSVAMGYHKSLWGIRDYIMRVSLIAHKNVLKLIGGWVFSVSIKLD